MEYVVIKDFKKLSQKLKPYKVGDTAKFGKNDAKDLIEKGLIKSKRRDKRAIETTGVIETKKRK